MRNVKLDRDAPLDLHEQVAGEIRRAIADGEAKPGERLPPAKDLAHILGVNTNTVLRALRQLRDEGLLEFRRGLGIRVAGTPEQGLEAGVPFPSRNDTRASPLASSVMTWAVLSLGLGRNVCAAAATAFWSRGVKARSACCTRLPSWPSTVSGTSAGLWVQK